MTIQHLLEKLKQNQKAITDAIRLIETFAGINQHKSNAILNDLKVVRGPYKKKSKKGHSYKGKHWTQTPEGRKKVAALVSKQWATKRRK